MSSTNAAGRSHASAGLKRTDVVREMLNNLVTSQSPMLATNSLMMVIAAIYLGDSVCIVLARRGARAVEAAAIGH